MHLHILGICGTFMGGLAALAREAGHRVTGCDAGVYPPMSEQLRALDIELIEGYGAEQLALAPDLFVVGNVVSRGNPLMEAILDAGARYTSGPQWLDEHVLQGRHVLAVAGTPPTRKPGSRPVASRIQASIAVVVVLPCVPATASTWRPCSTCSSSHRGPLV